MTCIHAASGCNYPEGECVALCHDRSNGCDTCDHKQHPDGGHCYMFREAPAPCCALHTGKKTKLLRTRGGWVRAVVASKS